MPTRGKANFTQRCEHCGEPFAPWANGKPQRFCSTRCASQAKTHHIEKTCERCGKAFGVPQNRSNARYCSLACRNTKTWVTCQSCGTAFTVKPSDVEVRRTCSRHCLMQLRSREGRHPRQGKHLSAQSRAAVSAGLHSYYVGAPEKHWNFQGGAFTQQRGPSWKAQRKLARERDGYACRVCGITEVELGKQLSVHHRRSFRLFASHAEANVLSNLVCTCQSCHMKLEHGKVMLPAPD